MITELDIVNILSSLHILIGWEYFGFATEII